MFSQNTQSFQIVQLGTKIGKTTKTNSLHDITALHYGPNLYNYCDHTNLYYFLEGEDEMIVDGKTYRVRKDHVSITPYPRKSSKKILCRSLKSGVYAGVGCTSRKTLVDEVIVIDASSHPVIKELFLRINEIWLSKYENYMIKTYELFYRLLIELEKANPMVIDKNARKINDAIKYIHEHYTEKDFSCGILPEICGVKYTYFAKLFVEKYEVTPVQYVKNLRLDRAVELLETTHFNIRDIADQVGYEDQGYFTRVFRKRFGISPSEYLSKL